MEKKKKISFTKTKIIVCVLCFVIGIGVIAYSIGLKNYNESREDERVYLTATVVEIDRDGLTGCRADTCKALSAKQCVDQRAFSHVGASRKSDLGHGIGGKLPWQSRTDT